MKLNSYLIFFFLLLIPFVAYFFRPDFIGNDTYGFLTLICQNDNSVNAEGLSFLVFSALPCNILALKALLFLLAFVSGCFLIKWCSLFSPENGWRASYLVFLSSVFVLEFAKLENDQLAYPFLFASLYFFFKKSSYSVLISLFLLGIAGLFWQGAIFYLIAFSIGLWPLLFVSLPLIFFFREQLIGEVIRFGFIAENAPLKFHLHFILNFGLLGFFLEPSLTNMGLFLFTLGMISNKFWILSLPFLVVGMILLLERIDREDFFHLTAIMSVVLVFGLAQSLWLNPPTENDWNAIEFAIEESGGEKINNDWGMGYWVRWKGGDTNSYQSPAKQSPPEENQLTITKFDLNCTPLKSFGEVMVFRC